MYQLNDRMNLITLDPAKALLGEHSWITTAIKAAGATFVAERKGQSIVYRTGVRSSMFREHVIEQVRKLRPAGTEVDDRSNIGIFSLLLSNEHTRLALIFKRLRGYKPSTGDTHRAEAIRAQTLPFDLSGAAIVPTWAYVGWKWDSFEQEIVSTRAACWRNGSLTWYIPDLSTMVGFENIELDFTEPASTEEFDNLSFDSIMRPRQDKEAKIIQLRDGTQDQP
jgi:hypothetical protein